MQSQFPTPHEQKAAISFISVELDSEPEYLFLSDFLVLINQSAKEYQLFIKSLMTTARLKCLVFDKIDLQTPTDFHKTISSIITNEFLDFLRHCKRLVGISFSQNMLAMLLQHTPNFVKQIKDNIIANPYVQFFDFSIEEKQSIDHFLAGHNAVKSLSLSNTDSKLQPLSQSISRLPAHIEVFSCKKYLIDADIIRNMLPTLTRLRLVTCTTTKGINDLLTILSTSTKLEMLALNSCGLDETTAPFLERLIGKVPSLTFLDLSNNKPIVDWRKLPSPLISILRVKTKHFEIKAENSVEIGIHNPHIVEWHRTELASLERNYQAYLLYFNSDEYRKKIFTGARIKEKNSLLSEAIVGFPPEIIHLTTQYAITLTLLESAKKLNITILSLESSLHLSGNRVPPIANILQAINRFIKKQETVCIWRDFSEALSIKEREYSRDISNIIDQVKIIVNRVKTEFGDTNYVDPITDKKISYLTLRNNISNELAEFESIALSKLQQPTLAADEKSVPVLAPLSANASAAASSVATPLTRLSLFWGGPELEEELPALPVNDLQQAAPPP